MAHAPTTLNPNRASLRNLDELPGPRPWPLLGNATQVRTDRIHRDVEQWVRLYGPMLRFSIGPLKILVVSDHQLIANLLRDRPDGILRPQRMTELLLEMGLKSGVFNAEGEAWQKQRRMVMAGFLPTQVRAYHPTLLKVAERLKGRWQKAARAGETLDLLPELMRYTVDGVAGLAFGADVNTLESDHDVIQTHLDKVFPQWFERITSAVPYWRFVKLPADRALDRSVRAINAAIDRFIAQARQRLADDPALRAAPGNLLEAMIVAADEPGSGLSDDDVAGNVLTMLLAGEDTTATTIAWLCHYLHQDQEVLRKVRAEVTQHAPGVAPLSPEHLAGMGYLDACINEALRLKPVAPFLPMESAKDMVIGDVAVPAGTLIWTAARIDAMDPARVPRPEAFLPERWLDEGASQGHDSSLKRLSIPFGAGPRVCPGRHLAITEIKMATAMLLTHFDIESVGTQDGLPPRELMAFTMSPIGLRMRLRERQPHQA
ncbi:MAG: cytochrome P450 [Aquabacterium sp.]